jgi:hypothetical protein
MPFVDGLKELVLQGASAAELKTQMIKQGFASCAWPASRRSSRA